MGRPAGVELDVQPERLAEVGDLHRAGDAHVVFGVGVDHVAAAGEQEARLLLQPADMLADQQRRLQLLAQPLVAVGRDAAVAVGVLVPEIAGLVAGAADIERVHPGAQLAGRVDHQGQPSPTASRTPSTLRASRARVAVVPAMDLEAGEARSLQASA